MRKDSAISIFLLLLISLGNNIAYMSYNYSLIKEDFIQNSLQHNIRNTQYEDNLVVTKNKVIESVKYYLISKFEENYEICEIYDIMDKSLSTGKQHDKYQDFIINCNPELNLPELMGYLYARCRPGYVAEIVTVEFTTEEIDMSLINQINQYSDLLHIDYVFLFSTYPIPDHIKALHVKKNVLKLSYEDGRLPQSRQCIILAHFNSSTEEVIEWYVEPPLGFS
jgi:hypothetical protein